MALPDVTIIENLLISWFRIGRGASSFCQCPLSFGRKLARSAVLPPSHLASFRREVLTIPGSLSTGWLPTKCRISLHHWSIFEIPNLVTKIIDPFSFHMHPSPWVLGSLFLTNSSKMGSSWPAVTGWLPNARNESRRRRNRDVL